MGVSRGGDPETMAEGPLPEEGSLQQGPGGTVECAAYTKAAGTAQVQRGGEEAIERSRDWPTRQRG